LTLVTGMPVASFCTCTVKAVPTTSTSASGVSITRCSPRASFTGKSTSTPPLPRRRRRSLVVGCTISSSLDASKCARPDSMPMSMLAPSAVRTSSPPRNSSPTLAECD
jgi:hypothetical protein